MFCSGLLNYQRLRQGIPSLVPWRLLQLLVIWVCLRNPDDLGASGDGEYHHFHCEVWEHDFWPRDGMGGTLSQIFRQTQVYMLVCNEYNNIRLYMLVCNEYNEYNNISRTHKSWFSPTSATWWFWSHWKVWSRWRDHPGSRTWHFWHFLTMEKL